MINRRHFSLAAGGVLAAGALAGFAAAPLPT
jgi:hypothetical protein